MGVYSRKTKMTLDLQRFESAFHGCCMMRTILEMTV